MHNTDTSAYKKTKVAYKLDIMYVLAYLCFNIYIK